MLSNSIKIRLKRLEEKQTVKKSDACIPIDPDAQELCAKWHTACQKVTNTKEEFGKLFFKALGDALAEGERTIPRHVTLDVVKRMGLALEKQGISI